MTEKQAPQEGHTEKWQPKNIWKRELETELERRRPPTLCAVRQKKPVRIIHVNFYFPHQQQ